MTFSEAKGHIRNIVKKYFAGATVDFANRSSSVMPQSPYVCITTGAPIRDQFPVERTVSDRIVRYYQTRLPVQIDLFTNGTEGEPDENGFVSMEDTSVEDLMDFQNYLESPYVLHWCDRIDAAIIVESSAQPLTGLITDTNYQFRSMMELTFCFVNKAVGYAGVQGEDSIQHPSGSGSGSPDTGSGNPSQPGDSSPPGQPGGTSSPEGDGSEPGYVEPDDTEEGVTIEPTYKPSPSGGRTEELVEQTETGYFTAVKIEYKKEESNP